MIEIVPATVEHAWDLGTNLRDDDLAEVVKFGVDPVEALIKSIQGSAAAWTALEDGRVVACWGVAPWGAFVGGAGCPWMLTSPAVERHKRLFMVQSKVWLAKIRKMFPHLETLVDTRYTRALSWLKWLGFTIIPGDEFSAVVLGE